jgi:hypothetical protein
MVNQNQIKYLYSQYKSNPYHNKNENAPLIICKTNVHAKINFCQ